MLAQPRLRNVLEEGRLLVEPPRHGLEEPMPSLLELSLGRGLELPWPLNPLGFASSLPSSHHNQLLLASGVSAKTRRRQGLPRLVVSLHAPRPASRLVPRETPRRCSAGSLSIPLRCSARRASARRARSTRSCNPPPPPLTPPDPPLRQVQKSRKFRESKNAFFFCGSFKKIPRSEL